jgi:flagellar biosynthesis/type III secretory pathway M-ring protein FliF/YscJ
MDMSMDNDWFNVVFSFAPTIAVGLILWFVMRAVIRADRIGRAAYDKADREEREAQDALKMESTDE